MIRSKIKSSYDKLTHLEQVVADYILNHPDETKTTTSYKLAQQLGVGQSTIIRFSQKLGFNSFRELLAAIPNSEKSDLIKEDVTESESTAETNQKIVAQYMDIIELTLLGNLPEIIDQAVRYIKEAEMIVCFGVGNSNLMAEYLSNQLAIVGINSLSLTNAHIVFSTIMRMKTNDIVILFSETGESKDVVAIARAAKKQGAKIIAITKDRKNTLQTYADLNLKTVNFGLNNVLYVTTIRCSQLCLIDMLILNLFKTNMSGYQKKFEESVELLKEYKYDKEQN